MKHFKFSSALAAGMMAALLAAGGAHANKLAGPLITGYVTSIQGTDSITIDGRTYEVAPDSAAADELSSFSPGQRVDAQLSGPVSSPDSQVIGVAVHSGE